ncbi:MAG: carbamoyltransferase C-terminal domain-containing protein [bacterium]|nr:carbamoyltransferase C-terminal domain-containing protein [bacterium]
MSQYILGLNGWIERSHDATACIVKDGRILAMAEEERFIRRKHAYDKIPIHATRWCLDQVGIGLDDIDHVALGWDYRLLYEKAGRADYEPSNLAKLFFPKKYFSYTKKPKIDLVPHHLAHAASAYYLSGMDEASILIVDGQGETESTTYAIGRGDQIEILDRFPISSSLGYFYEAIGEFIGLGPDAAGKTMGLASYGRGKYEFKPFKLLPNGYDITLPTIASQRGLDQQPEITSAWRVVLKKMFGEENEVKRGLSNIRNKFIKELKLSQLHKDIAASAQTQLEKTIQHNVNVLIDKSGINNLCIAGGVALNCTSNGKIVSTTKATKVFIPPFANDAGVSVGAALYLGGKKAKTELTSAYFGPSYSNSDIQKTLKKLGMSYKKDSSIEKKVASILAGGKTVAWFQGQMEIGPRALGNRSILANPSIKSMHKVVNEAKAREQWRPLSPSVLEEKKEEYFELQDRSPFMLFATEVKKEKRNKIPAVVHVDGSARPQTVSRLTNPRYHKLISEFEKLTAIPLVLNTSFNGAGEPIVCSPYDAISSFYTSSTDYLAINDFLIRK